MPRSMPCLHRSSLTGWCTTALSCCALLLTTSTCLAWGVTGHNLANNVAIDCLPHQLKPLYDANRAWIVKHSTDPDEWRRDNFAIESPRHFIDLDVNGPEGAQTYPDDYWVAAGILGKETVDKNGTVPWRITEYYGKLVRAYRSGDARAIIEISTWLGHYASDVHVPFHATANYDGQLTGQKGIHARFESVMVDKLIKLTDLKPGEAAIIRDPTAAAFRWARASLSLCPEILEADKRGIVQDANFGDNYYTEFASLARPIALHRLEDSARDTASLWFSAWVAAGRPDPPTATDVHAGEAADKRPRDPDIPAARAPSQAAIGGNPRNHNAEPSR